MKLIQWYPGHIAKAQRQLKERLGMVDAVVEMVDARMPVSSHFDFVDELLQHKQRVIVLNKIDLAPEESIRRAIAHWQSKGHLCIPMNIPERKGILELQKALKGHHATLAQKLKARGRLTRKLRVMVMGLPNVGKSTLINALIRKRSMKVGDKPGVTKSMQWVALADNLELLDTPGVIPPKLEDQKIALKLALIGSISTHAATPLQLAEAGVELFRNDYPGLLAELFGSDQMTLDGIGRLRNFKQQGDTIDLERTALWLLTELRAGRLKIMSFEAAWAVSEVADTEQVPAEDPEESSDLSVDDIAIDDATEEPNEETL